MIAVDQWASNQALLDLTVRENPYIPHDMTERQEAFLADTREEAMYGGAAGGGKSDALLMAALQYVSEPNYSALLLRRTYPELSLPDGLMSRAADWLGPTDARWREADKTWTFPGGATVTFGYLQYANDVYRYQGPAFQFVGYDELTQFLESQYRYLFSRLRRLDGSAVPVRMRSATNPGGIGHAWVKERFITNPADGVAFYPAKLDDNPHLDKDEYIRSLSKLSPALREQLLRGDWEVSPEGKMFKRGWFEIVDAVPSSCRYIRAWDLAATKPHKGNRDPDFTAGCKLGMAGGVYYVADMRRTRDTPGQIEKLVRQTAELDKRNCQIWMEEEGGASGASVTERYRRNILRGYIYRAERPDTHKTARAAPVAAVAEAGDVRLLRGPWNKDFLDEIEQFYTEGVHDDQVDALSLAFSKLSSPGSFAVGIA